MNVKVFASITISKEVSVEVSKNYTDADLRNAVEEQIVPSLNIDEWYTNELEVIEDVSYRYNN